MTVVSLRDPNVPARRVPWVLIAFLIGSLGVLGLFGWYVSIPVAAAVYALGFLVLTWFRPDLAFLLIFMTAPFVWDLGLGPVKMALSEVSLVLALPVLMFRRLLGGRPGARSPLKWPVAAYFLVCVVSVVLNGEWQSSITSMVQMFVYMVVAVYVFSTCLRTPADVTYALHGFLLANAFLAVIVIATRSSYILGLHKNGVGSQLAFAVVIGTELWLQRLGTRRSRFWFSCLFGLLAVGLVISLSRGAWMGAAAGIFIILGLRGRFKLLLRLAIVLIPVIIAAWLIVPEASKEYATDLRLESHNVKARLVSIDFAMTFFHESPIYGVGVGLRKTYDATNLVISTLAETGVLGLGAFLMIFVTFGWIVFTTRRRIAASDPMFSMLAIGAALMACKFLHGCVDHYWSRGMLPVWAGAGMAVFAFAASRRRSGRPATGGGGATS